MGTVIGWKELGTTVVAVGVDYNHTLSDGQVGLGAQCLAVSISFYLSNYSGMLVTEDEI